MTADLLKDKLRECIRLQDELKMLFHEESGCIANDSPAGMADRIGKSERLQAHITRANSELNALFELYSRNGGDGGGIAEEEIRLLFRDFRHRIYDTIGMVNSTIDCVKTARNGVAGKLRNMKKARVAMNAYARTG